MGPYVKHIRQKVTVMTSEFHVLLSPCEAVISHILTKINCEIMNVSALAALYLVYNDDDLVYGSTQANYDHHLVGALQHLEIKDFRKQLFTCMFSSAGQDSTTGFEPYESSAGISFNYGCTFATPYSQRRELHLEECRQAFEQLKGDITAITSRVGSSTVIAEGLRTATKGDAILQQFIPYITKS
ncbi:hypothetical protein PoB_007681500 [Plakobranchus ocellatus]|uniref:Uncharacterized protein n=1 Tax=Plakobranchus ocellatus TaxID=259542 RepID=A0AAV4E1S5_9GAST|nr:hypothetical protein PoB_007681500 [Plakobranchus ocellatus]